ncbi:VUT family protein [Streptomyces sp. 8L]|uniref:VUT family protein n=1 Tax=Streptomyces sp. 8L TaxID=2877242 RepID=UPI001CD6DB5C|nr:VUT family protein [Streptomyces sp. 8L]MCA1220204.1 VUT family protein [Streptomyces sp. 8L]
MTNLYGVVPVGGGLSVTAGTFAAGTGLLARDAVQDTAGRAWVLVGVAAGTALTAVTSPALALASAGAFLAAETIDMVVYTPLRHRGWARAVLASNTVGAALDTLLFLWLSGLPVTASSVGGQLIGKVAWATVLPVITVLTVRQVRRALPRHSLGA